MKTDLNDRKLIFIDYEYAANNYFPYDLSNFITESAFNYEVN
jgi:thiamine kinase-like enzyme